MNTTKNAKKSSPLAVTGVPAVIKSSQGRHEVITKSPPDSEVATYLATKLKDRLAFNIQIESWYRLDEKLNFWKLATELQAKELIEPEIMELFNDSYTISKLNNITKLLVNRTKVNSWTTDSHLLPVKNGVLNINTCELYPYGGNYKFTWQLPYDYQEDAQCPVFLQWLHDCCHDDPDQILRIHLCFRLLLSGIKKVQKFVEIIGKGKTGKSTATRLMTKFIGENNTTISDIRYIQGRFETASFKDKRLLLLPDQESWGGDLSILKNITGGDLLRYERKGQDPDVGFIADCLVVITANQPLTSSDKTTGLSRRRFPIYWDKEISQDDLDKWEPKGGIEKAMENELPGILNWALQLSETDVHKAIARFDANKTDCDLRLTLSTNYLAKWLNECCIEQKEFETFTGTANDKHTEKAYANYLHWCDYSNIDKKINLSNFGKNLLSLFPSLNKPFERKKIPKGMVFIGFRLRREGDTEPYMFPNIGLD